MDFYIIFIVIIVISFIQSIFGVGVLLFGTPILLILGYDFASVLTILLPISLFINILQVVQDKKHINLKYYKMILLYSIPPIVLLLWLTVELDLKTSLFIGLFLIVISLKSFSLQISKFISTLFSYQKSFLFFQGVVHGLTNLGGSLLTSNVFELKLNKNQTRATISVSYLTFAIFQLLTLVTIGKIQVIRIELIIIGVLTYLITNQFIYKKISNKIYDKMFAVFLFVSGLILIFKEIY